MDVETPAHRGEEQSTSDGASPLHDEHSAQLDSTLNTSEPLAEDKAQSSAVQVNGKDGDHPVRPGKRPGGRAHTEEDNLSIEAMIKLGMKPREIMDAMPNVSRTNIYTKVGTLHHISIIHLGTLPSVSSCQTCRSICGHSLTVPYSVPCKLRS